MNVDRDTILSWIRRPDPNPTRCMHGTYLSGPLAEWECATCVSLVEDDDLASQRDSLDTETVANG